MMGVLRVSWSIGLCLFIDAGLMMSVSPILLQMVHSHLLQVMYHYLIYILIYQDFIYLCYCLSVLEYWLKL